MHTTPPSKKHVESWEYPTFKQCIYKITEEAVKIFAAKIFLEYMAMHYLNYPKKIAAVEVRNSIIFAPLKEEVIFRFFILKGIYAVQVMSNRKFFKLTSTEKGSCDAMKHAINEREKVQKTFRIYLTALIFAAAHLANPHFNQKKALLQFCWSFLGGVIYGQLTEKYGSLAPGIIAHGLNNSIVVAAGIYEDKAALLTAAIAVNRIFTYILGLT